MNTSLRRARGALCRCLVLLGFIASAGPGWAWRSALYPQTWTPPGDGVRFETDAVIQDFSLAGYGLGEPLPIVSGLVRDVTQAPYYADPTGQADATTAIQSALVDAGISGGGVVFLPAGSYTVAVPDGALEALSIVYPNVVLRGAGIGQTFVRNITTTMRSKAVIRVSGPEDASWLNDSFPSTPVTTDLLGPTTVIPVDNPGLFAAGDWVVIRTDATNEWIAEHREPAWLGFGPALGGIAYYRQVRDVDAANQAIIVDIPTRYYLKQRDAARVHKATVMPLAGVGLEDFSIGNVERSGDGWGETDFSDPDKAAFHAHGSALIRFDDVRDSWVRRVASFAAGGNTSTAHLLSNGIVVTDSRSVTIENCHFQRPQYGGGGGNGYMYRLQNSSDCLVAYSSASFSRHGFVVSHMRSSGNVFHRCHDMDGGKQTGASGNETTLGEGSDHHQAFSHSNLIDGCAGTNSWWEAVYRDAGTIPRHTITAAHSVFWNVEGYGTGGAIVRTEQSRYGYAIGTRGMRVDVDRPALCGTRCDPPDHVEGQGLGSTLEPLSLFLDQRERRHGVPAAAIDLVPSADTYVRGGRRFADANYGAAASLQLSNVRPRRSRRYRESFLRFDLPGLTAASIRRATLWITATRSAARGAGGQAAFVADDSWSESTVTFKSRPPGGSVIGSWTAPESGIVEIDVTEIVRQEAAGDGALSLVLQRTGRSRRQSVERYGSREASDASQRPRLHVELGPAT